MRLVRRMRARNSRPMRVRRLTPAATLLFFPEVALVDLPGFASPGDQAEHEPDDDAPGCGVEATIHPGPDEEPDEGRHDQQGGDREQHSAGSQRRVAIL